jgi:hypothetical protein
MKAMSRIAAAAMPFAQLLGLSKAAEEEDGKKAKRAEEEDEQARAEEECEEEDEKDKDDKDDKKGKKSKRAEEEDGGSDDGDMQSERAEEEDDDDGDEKEKGKGRKAKSKGESSEDEEDDENGNEKSAARVSVRRERARCAKIIMHGINTGRVRQAGVLAFDTDLSVKAAIATLDAGNPDKPENMQRASLAERMAETQVPNVGADSGAKTPPGITKTAAAIIAIGEKLEKSRAQK